MKRSDSMIRRRTWSSPQVQIIMLLGLLLLSTRTAAFWSSSSKADTKEEYGLLVSPIVNRELETVVQAHGWPTTPQNVFCEAAAYHSSSSEDKKKKNQNSKATEAFLDSLVRVLRESRPAFTYRAATDLVLRAAADAARNDAGYTEDELLLEYSLTMRAYSPACELHRSLARQALQEAGMLKEWSSSAGIFAVAYPPGQVILKHMLMNYDLTLLKGFVKCQDDGQDCESRGSVEDFAKGVLLPGEVPIGKSSKAPLIVLYANMGTEDFADVYKELQNYAAIGNVRFVVRHLGDVLFEDSPATTFGNSSRRETVALQGYGVRLDIKNIEYKVFDDDKDAADLGTLLLNLTDQPPGDVAPPPHFLAGVNLKALIKSGVLPEQNDQERLLHTLWRWHEDQQSHSQIVPPVWQRRQLPMQAAVAVSSAADPLVTLQEVSQNLPSLASTLVHLKIPDDIQAISTILEKSESFPHSGRLYFNGRLLSSFERSSFNVFQTLDTLRQEMAAVQKLETMLGPFLPNKALQAVQTAWAMGSDFVDKGSSEEDGNAMMPPKSQGKPVYRIDVGRGWKKAIVYLNDLERDPEYSQWPRSLQQMFMSMQFGMAPSIRRNLFTFFGILDPTRDPQNAAFLTGTQLLQQAFPARIGILMVGQEDIDKCLQWLLTLDSDTDADGAPKPCPVEQRVLPVSPENGASSWSIKLLKDIPGTAHAVHRLHSDHVENYKDEAGAVMAYSEHLLDLLNNAILEKKGTGKILTMYDVVSVHSKLMERMHGISATEAEEQALETFLSPEDDDSVAKYGKAVRFAVDKGLKPGMSFLNGRPIMADGDDESEEIQRVFQEEQQHVFGLVQGQKITDQSPKSVYAMLLTGNKVFPRFHPLLTKAGGSDEAYLQLEHSFGVESLMGNNVDDNDEAVGARFVVNGFFELDTVKGLDLAANMISVLDSFHNSLDIDEGKTIKVRASYRVLPSTRSAAQSALCPILVEAGTVGPKAVQTAAKALSTILSADENDKLLTLPLEDLLNKIPGLPSDVREKILLKRKNDENPCTTSKYLQEDDNAAQRASANFVVGNGRVYSPTTLLVEGDFDLLLQMDIKRAVAVTNLLNEFLPLDNSFVAAEMIDRTVQFLAAEEASSASAANRVHVGHKLDVLEKELDVKTNPLRFSWNSGDDSTSENALKVQVTAVVDPVSDAAQRLSPLLLVIRDQLNLPLTLILSPATLIDGDDKVPITSYYRFVADPLAMADISPPKAHFTGLPTNHILTLRVDVPEQWDVQQSAIVQDTDNLRCDIQKGCGDEAYGNIREDTIATGASMNDRKDITRIEYGLNHLLIFGQCYDSTGSPPNGLELNLAKNARVGIDKSGPFRDGEGVEVTIGMDGSIIQGDSSFIYDDESSTNLYSDTLVMKTAGYWQLRANPGVWNLKIAENTRGAEIFEIVDGSVKGGRIQISNNKVADNHTKALFIKDFVNHAELLLVNRRPGFEKASLFFDETETSIKTEDDDTIHVFSLATGHLYERFLKIMMLSVTKRTSTKVKFWLFENFLSPSFKSSARAMAERIGCEVEFVTYKWPDWLRGQTEKQRIIWGYKILFLDVLFPLSVKKIIYVDADQVVRGDLKELWDMDLNGAPYGYTPMCNSRESTVGYGFWNQGFWKSHLRGKPYHISALYVVDLEKFRHTLVGDQLRAIYQQLSADPNSLANLDQDLPNYAQHQIPIFSLPQEWLWCESWCSDETKATSKTIDLCNNPLHKEPKVSMAKRIISGDLFPESWVELDAEVDGYEREYRQKISDNNA